MSMFYEAGQYIAKMVGSQLGQTNDGKPQVVFTFEVVSKKDGSPVKRNTSEAISRWSTRTPSTGSSKT